MYVLIFSKITHKKLFSMEGDGGGRVKAPWNIPAKSFLIFFYPFP